MTSKTPTPQSISALLKRAGFTRAVPDLRSGVSGFSVSAWDGGTAVQVRYSSISMGTGNEYRLAQLAKYAQAIEARGYATEIDAPVCRLIVTAKTEESANESDLRPCRRCGDMVAYLSSNDLCDGCTAEEARP